MVSQSQVPPPERLWHVSLGLASPLWPAFYAAAATGVAVWSFGAVMRSLGASAPRMSVDGAGASRTGTPVAPATEAAVPSRPTRRRRTVAAPAKGSPVA